MDNEAAESDEDRWCRCVYIEGRSSRAHDGTGRRREEKSKQGTDFHEEDDYTAIGGRRKGTGRKEREGEKKKRRSIQVRSGQAR